MTISQAKSSSSEVDGKVTVAFLPSMNVVSGLLQDGELTHEQSIKRRTRNIDGEDNTTSNLWPMFEEDRDTTSEQENEQQIKKVVDQIVTERLSGDPDEAHRQSAGIGVSNNHTLTLLGQNLAMTNEILARIKTIEMLKTIDQLVKPVADLFPHGVSEHPEPLLTVFNLGIPEQPQLNLIPPQNVSPVVSHSSTERPQQQLPYLGTFIIINQNGLRDCSVAEAHPKGLKLTWI